MEPVPVAERPVQVHDRGSLLEFGSVPGDVAVRETATQVAVDHGARRIAERAGVALRRVAISQRNGSYALERSVRVTPDDPDRVAADADIAGFGERAVFLPDGAAELPAPCRDFLAPENIDADGHAPAALADGAAPEDAALPAVAAFLAWHPRDGARLEAVHVPPHHDIDRAVHRDAAELAQALSAQQLDSLDCRKRQGVEIAVAGAVGSSVDQDQQDLSAGVEVADDAGIKQFLECLGAGPLDEVPVA